jgi:hypothetical protein
MELARELEPNKKLFPDHLPSMLMVWFPGRFWFTVADIYDPQPLNNQFIISWL